MKMLKPIREARRLTQEQCCQLLGGIPLHRWRRWENKWQNGKNDPPPQMRNAIADLLDVSLDQLAGRTPFNVPVTA